MAPVEVFELKLCLEANGRSKEMCSGPRQWTAIPAVTQKCADHILAVHQQVGYIVGLIENAFAVVGEFGREDAGPYAVPVQGNAVTSQSGHVESRASNVLC